MSLSKSGLKKAMSSSGVDKRIDNVINILSQLGDHFFLVSVNPPRGEAPEKLSERLKAHNKPSQTFATVS